jgi:hypothetical protein
MSILIQWLCAIAASLLVRGSDGSSSIPVANVPVQQGVRESPMLYLGEELEYRVSYSFFTVGTIRFKVTDREVPCAGHHRLESFIELAHRCPYPILQYN